MYLKGNKPMYTKFTKEDIQCRIFYKSELETAQTFNNRELAEYISPTMKYHSDIKHDFNNCYFLYRNTFEYFYILFTLICIF